MPIIFGWGRQTTKQIGIAFKYLCNHCHNEEFWILSKITTWFTLFFIPVIPYSTKYLLSCPVCQYGLTLDDKQLEQIKPIAETNQLLLDGHITQSEHQTRISQLNGNSSTDSSIQGEVVESKPLIENNSKLSYCADCGIQVTEKLNFCGNCGTKVLPK